ncbi:hypothetical protein [Thermotalea metallivorans]|uniref:Uncharacterized protein n=1 Tax=Thermotalea metallivorans TaxID=520762 RepID=A0A140L3I0_9FIRM|nr:hypothetical protein [Thermotalea metallivorans]KXG75105.1 hypothetical protein AN619_19310 [Thermotalea metallivorans]
MANPLAKSILGNIANKMEKKSGGNGDHSVILDGKYETLLKELIHKEMKGRDAHGNTSAKPLQWEEYLGYFQGENKRTEVREKIRKKGLMTLQEYGSLYLKNRK